MAFLIDSTVLIGLERRGQSPISFAGQLGEPSAISAVTLSELLFGLERAVTPSQRTARQAFIDATLNDLAVISFDLAVARTHAHIWALLVSRGQSIGTHDLMIAATALTYGYRLLTDNLREFSRVPGLNVRRPDW